MTIKILNENIHGTDLCRVEIDKKISIIHKSDLKFKRNEDIVEDNGLCKKEKENRK